MSYYLSRESSWARPSYQIDPHGEHIMSPLTRQLTETSDTSRCSDYSNQSSEYSISETSTEMPTYSFEGSSQVRLSILVFYGNYSSHLTIIDCILSPIKSKCIYQLSTGISSRAQGRRYETSKWTADRSTWYFPRFHPTIRTLNI